MCGGLTHNCNTFCYTHRFRMLVGVEVDWRRGGTFLSFSVFSARGGYEWNGMMRHVCSYVCMYVHSQSTTKGVRLVCTVLAITHCNLVYGMQLFHFTHFTNNASSTITKSVPSIKHIAKPTISPIPKLLPEGSGKTGREGREGGERGREEREGGEREGGERGRGEREGGGRGRKVWRGKSGIIACCTFACT